MQRSIANVSKGSWHPSSPGKGGPNTVYFLFCAELDLCLVLGTVIEAAEVNLHCIDTDLGCVSGAVCTQVALMPGLEIQLAN
mmetsp:Transcript_12240/g.21675  ORF Transcript_12240/g.21675 Transcript_12240/m.21675 type:complete len:82 (-) Transcript_12240:448-693(-)